MTEPTRKPIRLTAALAAALAVASAGLVLPLRAADAPAVEPVKIDVSKPPAIQKLFLKRLVNASLAAVVRQPEKPYTLIYQTILTRKGMERKYRQEASEALAKINSSDPAVELINGIGLVPEDDKATVKELVGLLMTQKPASLAKQKEKLTELASEAENPAVRQAAYAALAVAGGGADAVWESAASKEDGRTLLMGGIGLIADAKMRATFADKVLPLAAKAKSDAEQLAAIDAVSFLPGREADAAKALAPLIGTEAGPIRDAAIKSLSRIPAAKLPADQAAPLAAKLIDAIKSTAVEERVKPAGVDAAQAVKNLAGVMPSADGAALRKSLRDLVPTLVKIRTYREQMMYDTAYFVVPAGKPVQITLENDDAMFHNLVILAPGAFKKVTALAAVLPAPADDEPLPYVPKVPEVLHATRMATSDETLTLAFDAPAAPGDYPFVCTFPGHAERMHGVMLVVADIDAYEKNPKPPIDPRSDEKKPFKSEKNEPMDGPIEGVHVGH